MPKRVLIRKQLDLSASMPLREALRKAKSLLGIDGVLGDLPEQVQVLVAVLEL
jgi:hypothetical protein